MSTILDQARRFTKWNLKRNVQNYLNNNYDWKVTKAISTGTPLTQNDTIFRDLILKEYGDRLAAADAATSIEDLDKIPMSF